MSNFNLKRIQSPVSMTVWNRFRAPYYLSYALIMISMLAHVFISESLKYEQFLSSFIVILCLTQWLPPVFWYFACSVLLWNGASWEHKKNATKFIFNNQVLLPSEYGELTYHYTYWDLLSLIQFQICLFCIDCNLVKTSSLLFLHLIFHLHWPL